MFFFRTAAGSTNLWSVSVDTQQERPLTDLAGRRGTLGTMGTATDGNFIYFTWRDYVGDIWVTDIDSGE